MVAPIRGSQIQTNRATGSLKALTKLAQALGVSLDLLASPEAPKPKAKGPRKLPRHFATGALKEAHKRQIESGSEKKSRRSAGESRDRGTRRQHRCPRGPLDRLTAVERPSVPNIPAARL
jgi:transcriptional regulator with XRE-family HTH domain